MPTDAHAQIFEQFLTRLGATAVRQVFQEDTLRLKKVRAVDGSKALINVSSVLAQTLARATLR